MLYLRLRGGLAERSKAAVLKTVVPARVPGVRIPKPPPKGNCTNTPSVQFFFLWECFGIVIYFDDINQIEWHNKNKER